MVGRYARSGKELKNNDKSINQERPSFYHCNYGYGKLSELVSATKLFTLEERQVGDNGSKALYIRDIREK